MILGDEYVWATGYGNRRHLFALADRKKPLKPFESRPAWCSSGQNYVALDFFEDYSVDRERVMGKQPCKRCAKGLRLMQVERGEMPPPPYEPGWDASTGRFIVRGTDSYGWPKGWMALPTHQEKSCLLPEQCVIHHPSDHAMKDWPLYWRADRMLMERICTHGTGHPDPDDIAFKAAVAPDLVEHEADHGCDGCC